MYAIAEIVYGIPLNTNKGSEKWSEELELALDNEEFDGLMTFYSGGDCPPAMFGVVLGEFDEACHHVDLDSLKLKPTTEDIMEYHRMFEALPETLQQEIVMKYGKPKGCGEPWVFFLWSTS